MGLRALLLPVSKLPLVNGELEGKEAHVPASSSATDILPSSLVWVWKWGQLQDSLIILKYYNSLSPQTDTSSYLVVRRTKDMEKEYKEIKT